MPPRLVATDLDGTLVHTDGSVSARTRAALRRVEQAGALLVLVTGRPPRWLATIAQDTGHHGLAVCANGALLYDLHTEQVVDTALLGPGTAARVVTALRAAIPDLVFAVDDAAAGFGHEPSYPPGWDQGDKRVAPIEELLDAPLAKLLVRHATLGPDELLDRSRAAVGDLVVATYSGRDGLIEISGAGVTKATGLARLADRYGIDAAGVIAFGDMVNDLPMLSWAGHSVAVAGAHPDVLAVVDEVTAGADEDGVALVLERLFG